MDSAVPDFPVGIEASEFGARSRWEAVERHGQAVQKESEEYSTLSAELMAGWLPH